MLILVPSKRGDFWDMSFLRIWHQVLLTIHSPDGWVADSFKRLSTNGDFVIGP